MPSILKKILLSILIVIIYFAVWRQIRAVFLEYTVKPVLSEFTLSTEDNSIKATELNSISYYIYKIPTLDTSKKYLLKIPGGIFFLMGMITLVFFVGIDFKKIRLFFYIQIAVLFITLLFLFFGLYVHFSGIYMIDLLSQYGEPIVNLGFVLFLIQEKKKNDSKLLDGATT